MRLITFPKCVIIMSSNRKFKSLNITNKKYCPRVKKSNWKMATTEGHEIISNRKIKLHILKIAFNPVI